VDVLDGPGPQRVQSRFDARGWSPAEWAVMATLPETGAARGQRWAAVPALGGRANGAATSGQPGEHGEREGSKVSGAASEQQVTGARTARERQRWHTVQRAGDRRRAAAAGAQRRERRRLLATRPATLRITRAMAHRVYAGELGRAWAAAAAEKEEARRVTEGRMWEAAGRARAPSAGDKVDYEANRQALIELKNTKLRLQHGILVGGPHEGRHVTLAPARRAGALGIQRRRGGR
jgi:hypothetical protein